MQNESFGPLKSLIGTWISEGFSGENQAPDPDRKIENTKFRQETVFEVAPNVENHEQALFALRYKTVAWEEGEEDEPFHEELGYWIWDPMQKQVMKCFTLPRGISVLAGGDAQENSKNFRMSATLGSKTYGINSNKFLDVEFQTVQYDVTVMIEDENTFSYDEDSQIKIKGQDKIFHHTEKNRMRRLV